MEKRKRIRGNRRTKGIDKNGRCWGNIIFKTKGWIYDDHRYIPKLLSCLNCGKMYIWKKKWISLLWKKKNSDLQERKRENATTVSLFFFFLSKACEGKRGGLRPWLAAAVADDDGSAGFWFFFFRGALFCWPWNTRGKRREKEYKSRCCGPAGSKRAGGTRNGNDSLQGSLSLSLFFSGFYSPFSSFSSQKQLEAVKGEKAVKTPSSSSSFPLSFGLFSLCILAFLRSMWRPFIIS